MRVLLWRVAGRISALVALLILVGLMACAGAGDESDAFTSGAVEQESSDEEIERDSSDSSSAQMTEREDSEAVEESADEASADGDSTGFFQSAPLSDEARSKTLQQNRVIVRTVDMGIIVPDVPRAADQVVAMAQGRGGWQVGSERSRRHQAWLSVRVPAETLDAFVLSIRDLADHVDFETSTSQDVTDEYVDNQSRLNGLRATEERLLTFLEQSNKVEDALKVQAELTKIQLEIEAIQGRLRFLSQTAAYSLVNLTLTTKPGNLPIEIGPDTATYRADLNAGFRATFEAPDGVDEFTYTWDFGDGSDPVQGSRTAPTTTSGERVTSTVSHTFTDVDQSPYIVQLDITGIGDAGLFEGSDTLIATVTEIPGIEVFAGEDRVVDEGDEVEYSGSFTRPEALRGFEYRWDFGDGTATVFDVPLEGETRATASHRHRDYRPEPYRVVLTVTAQSDAGEVKGSGVFYVQVNDVEGFVVGGWDVGGTAKSAVRALTAVGQALLIVLIWVGILSPVWVAVLAAVILFPRIRRRFPILGGGGPAFPAPPGRRSAAGRPTADGDGRSDETSSVPQADADGSPLAFETVPGAVICHQCGREIPGDDPIGHPPRYCPFCGADTTPSDY